MGIAKNYRIVIALLGAVSASGAASAAKITWGSPTIIGGPTDVVTQGSPVYAYSLGNNVTPVVNGVTFTPAVSNGGSPNYDYSDSNVLLHNYIQYTGFNGPPTEFDAQYTNLLTSAGYAPGTTNPITFTLNVTQGQTYELQVWANDARGSNFAATESISDPSGGSGSLVISESYGGGFGGTYNIGTFLADGPTQQLTFVWSGGPNTTAQVNAFQLRNITVTPEPAMSAVLMGMGAMGLSCRDGDAGSNSVAGIVLVYFFGGCVPFACEGMIYKLCIGSSSLGRVPFAFW